MAYKPGSILLVTFGRYAKYGNGKRKERLPSIAQIPLMDSDGFSYVDGYLSNLKTEGETSPEAEKKDQILLSSAEQREYIRTVASAFRDFPVNVKCEGVHGRCEKGNIADKRMVPFERVSNHPKRVEKKMPQWVNLLDFPHNYFNCGYCTGIRKAEKDDKRATPENPPASGYLEMDISFSLPDCLTQKPEMFNWLFNMEEFYETLRRISYHLKDHGIGDVIDSALIEKEYHIARENKEKIVVGKYTAQRIVSRLLRIPEDEIPKKDRDYKTNHLGWKWMVAKAVKPQPKREDVPKPSEDYAKTRELYATLHIPTKEEKWELLRLQMKNQKRRKPLKEYPGQPDLGLVLHA